MYNDRHLIRNIEQETVAHHLASATRHLFILHHGKKPRVHPLHHQSSRVIIQVFLPSLQLSLMQQNLVIIPQFKEPLPWCRIHPINPPVSLVASHLKPLYHHSQRTHLFLSFRRHPNRARFILSSLSLVSPSSRSQVSPFCLSLVSPFSLS